MMQDALGMLENNKVGLLTFILVEEDLQILVS